MRPCRQRRVCSNSIPLIDPRESLNSVELLPGQHGRMSARYARHRFHSDSPELELLLWETREHRQRIVPARRSRVSVNHGASGGSCWSEITCKGTRRWRERWNRRERCAQGYLWVLRAPGSDVLFEFHSWHSAEFPPTTARRFQRLSATGLLLSLRAIRAFFAETLSFCRCYLEVRRNHFTQHGRDGLCFITALTHSWLSRYHFTVSRIPRSKV